MSQQLLWRIVIRDDITIGKDMNLRDYAQGTFYTLGIESVWA